MKAAVQAWARDEVSIPVVWGEQDAPSPAKPFVKLQLTTAPVQEGQAEHRILLAILVETIAAETIYTATINGDDAMYESSLDPSANAIRDGLAAAITALDGDVKGVAVLDGVIALVLEEGAAQPTVELDDNLRLKIADLVLSDGVATFSIDAFADPPTVALSTATDATSYATTLKLSIEADDVLEELRAAGWAYAGVVGDRRPTLVVGSRWEDRAGFDLRLRCRMRNVRLLDFIETVTMGDGVQEVS